MGPVMINLQKIFRLLFYSVLLFLLFGCAEEKEMPLSDILNIKMRVTVNGQNFDIPMGYAYQYKQIAGAWPIPSQDEIDGKLRRKVDSLWIQALLPALDGYSEANHRKFNTSGYGDVIRILVTKLSPLCTECVLDGRTLPVEARPGVVVSMGKDKLKSDLYISMPFEKNNYFMMRCGNRGVSQYQSCKVDRNYGDYNVHYSFSMKYIDNVKDVDGKVLLLIDSLKTI